MAYLGRVVFNTTVDDNTISSSKIVDLNVTTQKLAASSVTGPKLGAITSSELATAVTDETGSGSLAFANSPTFLGTPQAPTAAQGTANAMVATTAFVTSSPLISNATLTYGAVRDAVVESLFERANVRNEAIPSVVTFNVLEQSAMYFTANATANVAINFRGNSTTTLNSALNNLQNVVTAVVLITNGVTPFYPNNVLIDGTVIHNSSIKGNLYWQANVLSAGGYSTGIDAYTFTIIKKGDQSYTVLASQNQFKSFLV